MASKEERYAEAYRRDILPADIKSRYEEAVRRGLMHNPELKAKLDGVDLPDLQELPPEHQDAATLAMKESARAILTGAANLADVIPAVGDSFVSAASWAAHQFGIGDGTYTPATRFKDLLPEEAKPQTSEGKLAAEIIPYLVGPEAKAADAAGAARKLMDIGEKVMGGAMRRTAEKGIESGIQSVPGSIAQSDVTGDNPLGIVAENALFGGILHAGGKLLGAGVKAVTGAKEGAALDLIKLAADEGVHPSVMKDLPELLQDAGKAAQKGEANIDLAYSVQPSEKILSAADELGVKDLLLPSHYSQNSAYQAIEQGLKSIPGSALDAHERKAIEELAKKTDELITEYGGTIDKSELSDRFKSLQREQIQALEEKSNDLFHEIDKVIPGDKLVATNNIMEHLQDKAKMLGGTEFLSSAEQNVLKQMNPETMPTYARLTMVRQQIGDAISKKQGPFKDIPTGELKQLYGKLSEDQNFTAGYYGVGDKYKLANDLVFQRKALEKDLVNLLGKDLSSAITTKTGQGVKGLMHGNYKAFDQVLAKVPDGMRQELVLTALNDAFTQGSRMEKMLNIPGFVDWYQGLLRNPEAMKRITANIPKEASDRLKNIYEVANGIRKAKSNEISTGRINTLIEQFDRDGGKLAKIFGVGAKVAATGAAGVAAGPVASAVTSTAISLLSRPKDKLTVLADKLLASQEFKGLTKRMASGGADTAAQRDRLNTLISRSEVYQKWKAALSLKEQQAITRAGIVNWLLGDE